MAKKQPSSKEGVAAVVAPDMSDALFNRALKRVWSAPPAPRLKKKKPKKRA